MGRRAAFEALKPCPCCGGEPELRYQGNDFTRSRKLTVRCKSCRLELTHAAMRHDFAWLEDRILRDWNRRQSAGAEVAQERIDDLMRKAGMQEIKDADYRSSMGQPMTVDEQSRLDAARRFAQLLVADAQEKEGR